MAQPAETAASSQGVRVARARARNKASYWTLRRYAMQELGWRKKQATILLEDPPAGQEAQIDFGEMGIVVDT
jgi:hypothetical protein